MADDLAGEVADCVVNHLGNLLSGVRPVDGEGHPHQSEKENQRADNEQFECQGLIDLQAKAGGDSLIGRRLYPLVSEAGLESVHVSQRMVYVDSSKPALVDGFTRKTFTAMVEGIREPAIANGLMSAADFDRGIADLYRSAQKDGTFCYTFFKATARKPIRSPAG